MSANAGLPVQVGDVLAGKYRVERVLGAGAMGVVAEVTHRDLGERRAIKFMRPSLIHDAGSVERFLREARATARLKSRHVARVHDVGRLDGGAPYIVMEHFEGTDLKAILAQRGALPAHEAVRYVRQACEAIAEAHAAGIIHRDLKPSNLFIAKEGGAPCVKVLDFGVAKLATEAAQDPGAEMTGTSDVLGTPLYMAPEQMRSTRTVDGRADVWSLGVILYRSLTGKAPFAGQTTPEVCVSVMVDEPPPPSALRPDLPRALDVIVMRCLEKSPERRFAGAGALSDALAPLDMPAHEGAGGVESSRMSVTAAPATSIGVSGPSATATGTDTSWAQAGGGSAGRSARGRILAVSALAITALAVGAIGARLIAPSSDGDAATATESSSPRSPASPSSSGATPDVSPVGPASASAAPLPADIATPAASQSASAGAPSAAPAGSASPKATPAKRTPAGRPTAPLNDAFGTSRK